MALLIRIIYLYGQSLNPGFLAPIIDERWHWEWAQSILAGSADGDSVFFRAPLYAYFLALLSAISGSSIFWSKFLQLFLTLGTSFFLFKLSEQMFNRPIAIISGFIYAFYGTLIFYETMFLIPVLFLFLTVWGMFRLIAYRQSSDWKSHALNGLIFGLAVIARPNILIVLPFLALWIFLLENNTAGLMKRMRKPLILAAGVIIVISPVTIKNYVASGEFIPVASQGGINLYLGNNPRATGLSMAMPEVQLDMSIGWNKFISATSAAAEREAQRSLGPGQVSAFWGEKAAGWMWNNKADFFHLLWKKTVYLFNGFENSDNINIYFQRRQSVIHSVLVWDSFIYFPFGLLLPFFFAGLYLTRKKFKTLLPLYIYLLAYIPTIVLFLVTARHRLPIIIFMIIFASAGAYYFFDLARQKRLKEKIISFLIFLVTLFLVNQPSVPKGAGNDFQNHYNEGLKALRSNDYLSAEKAFKQADKYFSASAALLNNLGYSQFRLQKFNEADRSYHRAIAVDPIISKSYYNLAKLVEKQSKLDSANVLFQRAIKTFDTTISDLSELGLYYAGAAVNYEKLNKIDSALSYYETAVSDSIGNIEIYYQAATFFARNERYNKSDSLFAIARKFRLPTSNESFNWGNSFLKRKMWDKSIWSFVRAVKKNPQFYQAFHGLAVAHFKKGSPSDSVLKYIEIVTKINPGYAPTHSLEETLKAKIKK